MYNIIRFCAIALFKCKHRVKHFFYVEDAALLYPGILKGWEAITGLTTSTGTTSPRIVDAVAISQRTGGDLAAYHMIFEAMSLRIEETAAIRRIIPGSLENFTLQPVHLLSAIRMSRYYQSVS